jgi:hypothetical protein
MSSTKKKVSQQNTRVIDIQNCTEINFQHATIFGSSFSYSSHVICLGVVKVICLNFATHV